MDKDADGIVALVEKLRATEEALTAEKEYGHTLEGALKQAYWALESAERRMSEVEEKAKAVARDAKVASDRLRSMALELSFRFKCESEPEVKVDEGVPMQDEQSEARGAEALEEVLDDGYDPDMANGLHVTRKPRQRSSDAREASHADIDAGEQVDPSGDEGEY